MRKHSGPAAKEKTTVKEMEAFISDYDSRIVGEFG